MGFREEFDEHQSQMNKGDFFKYKKDGNYKFRIISEPLKKVSRFHYGICYEGAPYCSNDAIDADWEKAKAKAKAEGGDVKKVKRPGLSIKWMTWAYSYDAKEFVILEMTNDVATKIRVFMDSDDYGFKTFPMPYDININVKNAGTIEAEYTVLAARNNTEISPDLVAEIEKLTPIDQVKERMQAKARDRYESGVSADKEFSDDAPKTGKTMRDVQNDVDEEIDPNDIPF